MKLNSISGVHYAVEDLARTAAFYEAIGFRRGKEESGRLTFYVNWFFVTFVDRNGAEAQPADNGAGVRLYIKVDDLDEFHDGVVSKGLTPASEPQAAAKKTREFALRDPNGYELVFFEKK